MVVDYSKWDNLELSDDSDIEVHPNVDKRSFIRWKQRDIHEKRERDRIRSAQLEVNLETNHDLLKCVDELLRLNKEESLKIGQDVERSVELAVKPLGSKTKPELATSPEQPRYADMIESMLVQITQGTVESDIPAKLVEHRSLITGALKDEQQELDTLKEERKRHVTSDDLKTAWDSSFVNQKHEEKPAEAAPRSKQVVETLNTPNSPSQPTQTEPHEPEKDEEGLEKLLPATETFGRIKVGDFMEAYRQMAQHREIVTEGQKDALIMTAFDAELGGEAVRARQIVFNAQLLQYAALLGGSEGGIRNLVTQLSRQGHPARQAFETEVETTYNHIHERCKVLAEQKGEQQEEQIQLYSVDPDNEIRIQLPTSDDTEYWLKYQELPLNVREALETRKLDEINAVLASMNVSDAEKLVGQLGECGVLQVEPKVYDSNEWEQKREKLAGELAGEPSEDESPAVNEVNSEPRFPPLTEEFTNKIPESEMD